MILNDCQQKDANYVDKVDYQDSGRYKKPPLDGISRVGKYKSYEQSDRLNSVAAVDNLEPVCPCYAYDPVKCKHLITCHLKQAGRNGDNIPGDKFVQSSIR